MKKILLIMTSLFAISSLYSQASLSADITGEFGFTGIISHLIQSGTSSDKGDVFNYVTQGSQDNLVPFSRFEVDASLFEKHHLIFLYQPLTIETQAEITDTFEFNQVTYNAGSGFLDLTYAFDFWRVSYLYDFIEPGGFFLSAGLSLQVRNASIIFKASDTDDGTVSNNIGPVPIVKLKFGYEWDNGVYVLFDGDGFYASNKFFNGADYPFTGYIYDLSLRGGYHFNEITTLYLNGRFLGGGGEGTDDEGQYTFNDLHTFSLSLGLTIHI
jgi:hypothetical protein